MANRGRRSPRLPPLRCERSSEIGRQVTGGLPAIRSWSRGSGRLSSAPVFSRAPSSSRTPPSRRSCWGSHWPRSSRPRERPDDQRRAFASRFRRVTTPPAPCYFNRAAAVLAAPAASCSWAIFAGTLRSFSTTSECGGTDATSRVRARPSRPPGSNLARSPRAALENTPPVTTSVN
jgi:hypothetical protein